MESMNKQILEDRARKFIRDTDIHLAITAQTIGELKAKFAGHMGVQLQLEDDIFQSQLLGIIERTSTEALVILWEAQPEAQEWFEEHKDGIRAAYVEHSIPRDWTWVMQYDQIALERARAARERGEGIEIIVPEGS